VSINSIATILDTAFTFILIVYIIFMLDHILYTSDGLLFNIYGLTWAELFFNF
jgi:hypothetical protein